MISDVNRDCRLGFHQCSLHVLFVDAGEADKPVRSQVGVFMVEDSRSATPDPSPKNNRTVAHSSTNKGSKVGFLVVAPAFTVSYHTVLYSKLGPFRSGYDMMRL